MSWYYFHVSHGPLPFGIFDLLYIVYFSNFLFACDDMLHLYYLLDPCVIVVLLYFVF